MKKIFGFLLIFGLLSTNCSKKKDDNTLRDLLILGFLTAPKSETVALTPGVTVRQKVAVTAGQEMKYTVSQASSTSSSTLSRNTSFDNRVVVSLVDNQNKELYSIITIPGTTETLSYTPKESGEFTVVITPVGKATVTTSVTGGSSSNSLGAQNSSSSAISGKKKYKANGAILQGSWLLVKVEEVQSIASDGKATFKPITDAVVTLTVDDTTNFTATYNANHSLGQFNFPWSGYANDQVGSSFGFNLLGRKLRLRVTHPTLTDLNLDATLSSFPNTVTDVRINGVSSANASGETLTIDKNDSLVMTWKNATTSKPDLTQFQVNASNNTIFTMLMPAELETITISKTLLSGLTSSSATNNDNCIGAIGGAGTAARFDTDFFVGIESNNEVSKSGFFIVNFDFFPFNNAKFNQPRLGFFCEQPGPINPLTVSQFSSGSTFNSAGIPLLVVK